jgi:hypothetical protein
VINPSGVRTSPLESVPRLYELPDRHATLIHRAVVILTVRMIAVAGPLDLELMQMAVRPAHRPLQHEVHPRQGFDGMTPAQALAAGGESRLEALALIDDCEWRRRRKADDGEDVTAMPDRDEIRLALGLPR